MGPRFVRQTRHRLATAVIGVALVGAGATVGIAAAAPNGSAGRAAPAALDPAAPQEPFLCTTEYNGLGQPIVDNQAKRGTPVYPETTPGVPDRTKAPVGWSSGCQVQEQVEYRYRATDGQIRTLPAGLTALPTDVATIAVTDLVGADQMALGGATEIPYLFRYQRGTLPENRFLYSIAMLVPVEEYLHPTPGTWDHSHWNRRLLYSFSGGVGIGHSQGDLHTRESQLDQALRLGHAIVYSSGTRTSTHYNLKLGGRTAVELKARFVADHAAPLYTVGIGGSGGGIQQYVYAQNHPELLDALIPEYSYPDMTTQTINVGDCELLEHYMDVTDGSNPRWQDWDHRKILQGQNTIEGFESDWQRLTGDTGSSECIEGWRGATPLALNPTFGLAVDMEKAIAPHQDELIAKILAGQPPVPDDFPDLGRLLRTSPNADDRVEWTHWADVVEVYGVDPATGYARVPWDNVGVQYGLRAVARGQITPAEFLKLNREIGSWKPSEQAVPESCGLVKAMAGDDVALLGSFVGLCSGNELDQYSSRMMRLSPGSGAPAPRTEADIDAIRAAFESGLEFDGRLPRDVPILDVRHYLEHELDMHNVHQSFVTRERIRRTMGDADNQVIWFLDARPSEDESVTDRMVEQAFRVMDEWVANMRADAGGAGGRAGTGRASAADAKPAAAVDSCWTTDGSLIASGDDVWSGAVQLATSGEGAWTNSAPTSVDGVAVGACSARFPIHSTSRIVAGGPITNDVYKCFLKPVAQAVADGDYGDWTPSAAQQAELERTFPTGVCDWSHRSVGHPDEDEWVPPTTTTTTAPTTTTGAATTTSGATTEVPTTGAGTDTTRPGEPGDVGDRGAGIRRSRPLSRTGSADPMPLVVLSAALVSLGVALVLRARARTRRAS